jgi:DNA-binding FadR family transcriptional regulator
LEQVSRGYVVRNILADEVLDTCEARMGLESTAARCAAERRTELDLVKLAHIQEESAPGKQDRTRHLADVSFHQALRQAAHNLTIVAVLDRLDALLAIHDTRVGPDSGNLKMIWQKHQRILDAVRERDAERAQSEMLAHQVRTRDLRLRQLAGMD